MGTDVLTTFRTNIRGLLADTGSLFPDAMIDAGVFESVADISRLAPRELVHVEVLHSRTVTAETFTNTHGTFVSLANKPIDMQAAVTLTNNAATVTYVENTDYIIDYAQGRVQSLSAGNMTNSATHKITYEKSLRAIDISSLTDFISIDRLEWARAGGNNYQTYSSFYLWGDILWLQARSGSYGSGNNQSNTQENLSENDHIRVWYKAEHTKPGAGAGSYPAYMDDVVTKGGAAYALFSKHRERNLQVVTDLASARTALALADDDQSAMDTLWTAVTTALDAAKVSLGLVDALTDLPLQDAETALDALITQLGTVNAAAELGAASTILNDASGVIKSALDRVLQHLETNTTNPDSAKNQLKTGDGLINTVNFGADAALLHARYAEVEALIARGFTEEAATHIAQAQGLVSIAGERAVVSTNYIGEANGRLGIAAAIVNAALGYMREADSRVAAIDRHLALGQLYVAQARGYQEGADRESQAADRFLFDAQERHRDYWDHLRSKVEMSPPNPRGAATQQNP